MKARKEPLKNRAVQNLKDDRKVRLTLDLLAGAVLTAPAGTLFVSDGGKRVRYAYTCAYKGRTPREAKTKTPVEASSR